MGHDPRNQIENLRERIGAGEDVGDNDRDFLLEFSDKLDLLAQEYSDYRHLKLLRHCTIMAENLEDGTLAAALENRDAAESIVAWINRNYDNEETNRDYRSAIRVFAKRVTEGGECPDSVDWVPTGTSSNYDPSPDPRQMLKWDEHVEPMADECFNARDAAMITMQFDAGLRGGEFKDLTVGDIQDHDHGLQVTVEGKQGRRTILLIPSVPYVNRWLDAHPDRDDPDAPLWSKITKAEPISDRMVSNVFDEAADRADIDKPVTLTNFRKSSAAYLASRNLNQAHIEEHHGWVRGSRVAARYISVFSEDSDLEIARAHGVDVEEDEHDPIAPLECTRCGRETPRSEPLCVWCGQAMDPKAAVELDEADDREAESLADLPPEKAKQVLELADVLDDPEVRSSLLDR
ncbi:site-specific integrase [Natronobacterium gregoryi]|uniref:Integrase family protein n=2 Tax=Natronobacterium gregoryi TaxID=44930 RepID=L0ANH1_NATGS|nr:site-specific integrase [Natronobacterium gregoryi]AFZ74605.1 site-specific recombinase XerD [Natronobacterium gregoryi SP2]ELY72573.1 integrase family protein [Natronobacterium gregoryi SP2]PLK19792.1 site-specific integrase [Natronobacterium gregoryi SP2]SFJ30337.1 Phage integrase family protein [Natronobacterium gregoryi]